MVKRIIVICYVDGLIVFADSEDTSEKFKLQLNKKFELKDLIKPTKFLGIDLIWQSDGSVEVKLKGTTNKVAVKTHRYE